MTIEKNYDLSHMNTFGVKVRAKFFAEVNQEEDLAEIFNSQEFKENNKIFLGGGSNVLFTKDWDGIVVLNKLKGVEILDENEDSATVRAMGGVVWHDLVTFAVERGYWGIENLSLIPGSVGAAPMQNIGAYGAELKNTLLSVEAYELATGNKKIFNKEECMLGYRDSVFKNTLRGKYFISAVILRLSKKEEKNVSYRVLKDYLEKNQIEVRGPRDISEAVAAIRRSKLPDPKEIGNAGSFFKNVFVTQKELEALQANYPDIPYFKEPSDNGSLAGEKEAIKIPAGWLVEKAGWKGYRSGNVGVHDKQALVLVNHGGATGQEIAELARNIIESVADKFGLKLIPEVNIV